MSEGFMFLNPYTTFVGSSDSVQLLVGIMFGIVLVILVVLGVVEAVYKLHDIWKNKFKK